MPSGADPPSALQLLGQHVEALAELRKLKVIRTENNPTGDYAEWLFVRAMLWKPEKNSAKGFDAVDTVSERKFQIKARRLTSGNSARQLSFIRDLEAQPPPFDMLAAVLFGPKYEVIRAALIPVEVVRDKAVEVKRVNGWRFVLTDAVWHIPDVEDVTERLRRAQG